MLTTTVKQLKRDDVYTDDGGESWWKVECNDRDRVGRRIFAECVQANPGADEVPGNMQSAVYSNDHEVVVRL